MLVFPTTLIFENGRPRVMRSRDHQRVLVELRERSSDAVMATCGLSSLPERAAEGFDAA
jgi:hypothetical protein